jgi:hypothetical protein
MPHLLRRVRDQFQRRSVAEHPAWPTVSSATDPSVAFRILSSLYKEPALALARDLNG